MNNFEIVASSTESTVVAEYTPEKRKSTDMEIKYRISRESTIPFAKFLK